MNTIIITILIFAFLFVLACLVYVNTRNTAKEYPDEEVDFFKKETDTDDTSEIEKPEVKDGEVNEHNVKEDVTEEKES